MMLVALCCELSAFSFELKMVARCSLLVTCYMVGNY